MAQLTEHSSGDNRCDNDFYATRDVDTMKLLNAELPNLIGKRIWECACGTGNISEVLINAGLNVYSSDKIDYGYGDVIDFLECYMSHFDVIITNPPYYKNKDTNKNMAEEFVKHALEQVPDGGLVIMMLRTLFLEGIDRYENIFSKNNPRNVYIFSKRTYGLMNGVTKPSTAISYSWFVWEKGYNGDTIIKWI